MLTGKFAANFCMKHFQDFRERSLLFAKRRFLLGKMAEEIQFWTLFFLRGLILNCDNLETERNFSQAALAHSVHIGKNIADI
jgi:hypothetical protein